MSSPVVPNFFGLVLQRSELVLEDQLGVVEETADQRRLAVIDGTAGEEAQEALGLLLGEKGGDGIGCSGLALVCLDGPAGENAHQK